MAGKWLSIQDVADELDVNKMTAYRLVHAGVIQGYRFGRQFRVKPEDLEAYIRDSRVSPAQAAGDAGGM